MKTKNIEPLSGTNLIAAGIILLFAGVIKAIEEAEPEVKEPEKVAEPKPDGYVLDGKFYETLDIIHGLHIEKDSKPIPVYFAKK